MSRGAIMFIAFRALVYASLFVGFVLVYVPASLLAGSGIGSPQVLGPRHIASMIVGALGGALALWSVVTLVAIGRGTPAPFDPPRRLVVRGPYRFIRNPMYIGAGLALAAAALFYESWAILAYTVFLLLACHLFVVFYEESVLRRTFGHDYDAYCRRVRRWWPRLGPGWNGLA